MKKWVIHAMRIYGRSLAIDDVADFPKIKGKFVVHHWVTGVVLSMISDYLLHREKRKEAGLR
jgi:hypothetical protein